jgi:hypothetical protein
VAATAILIAALAWIVVGVPTFVKYPTDLDITPQYEGTFTLLVDPATAAPLDDPLVLPLTIDRHIEVIDSGATRAVVQETIQQRAGDLVDTTQTNVYVLDRSTLENVEDARAYAFEPSNVVDRSGTFRVNLPFNTDADGTYEIYSNDIGTTYEMRPDTANPVADEAGLELHNFVGSVDAEPMDPAYFEEISGSVSLPTTMTLDQLQPQLLAMGVDVEAIVAAISPVISAEDMATLVAATGEPIGLDYFVTFEGRAAIETTTGAQVHVSATESVLARPQLTALPVLVEVLGRYPQVPAAVDAVAALEELATAPPTPLYEYTYDQTPASVEDVGGTVASLRNQVRLAKMWLPIGLLVTAALVLVISTLVFGRRPERHDLDVIDLRLPKVPEPEDRGTLIGSGGR